MKARIAVSALVLSAAGFTAWIASEGYTPGPVIPTKGDVPTIGHGSTKYEDGRRVRMTDAPITRKSAEELARALHAQEPEGQAAQQALRRGYHDVALHGGADHGGEFVEQIVGGKRFIAYIHNLCFCSGQ